MGTYVRLRLREAAAMTPGQDAGGLSTAADDDWPASQASEPDAPLNESEQRELLDRERQRMESPGYKDTLEDLSAAIEAHLQHHGRL
jgi:hypothetical protein